jgi:lipopolysaccharide assembly protein A
MKRLKRLLLVALVLAAGLWAFLFSLANSEPAALDLVFTRLEPAALSVWLIAAFVAGGLCGLFAGSVAIWRAQRALSRSRRAPAAPVAAPAPSGAAAATR